MGNSFVYVQLQTQDVVKAKGFYAQLFDWEFEERQTPMGLYVEILVNGGKVGGMVGHLDVTTPSHWVPYVKVADVKAATEKARRLGATVRQGPVQLPDKSWFTLMVDTTGATVGLHQPAAD